MTRRPSRSDAYDALTDPYNQNNEEGNPSIHQESAFTLHITSEDEACTVTRTIIGGTLQLEGCPGLMGSQHDGACRTLTVATELDTGVKSVCGRRPEMEDAVTIVPRFFSLPFCQCWTRTPAGNPCLTGTNPEGEHLTLRDVTSGLHFFGVYDGHGGAQAANYCREHLHLALADELRRRLKNVSELRVAAPSLGSLLSQTCGEREKKATITQACEQEGEEVASTLSSCPPLSTSSSSSSLWPSNSSSGSASTSSFLSWLPSIDKHGTEDMDSNWREVWDTAMNACFRRIDEEVGSLGGIEDNDNFGIASSSSDTVGCTAVIAVVSCCQIIVANCGDSRAILSRAGKAIALSTDHKPEREDEMSRIEAAGGRVICWNGYRVLGILAMSRAIGDHFLKPFVIADPEVTWTQRSDEDECLILASDGLWDVLSNEDVCKIARKCFLYYRHQHPCAMPGHSAPHHHHHPCAMPRECAAQIVASVLVNMAYDRGSTDNISVVVVDLRRRRPSN